MKEKVTIAVKYAIFAGISIGLNLLTQTGSLHLYHGKFAIYIALLIGTGVGVISKYLLDKHYIFQFKADKLTQHGVVFFLYVTMSMVTTAIFWGFELGFYYLFHSHHMALIGGFIGLIIGYWVKYNLDKKFTFRKNS